jgi:signal transduction histidine kinase
VIWYELLSNALRNARQPLKIKLGWNEDSDGYCFWVSDDAGGVPMEKRKELFQPFETLSQPDSVHGLGLSIVQRLVRLQKGRCGYEPIANNGSMFYFILPAGDE